MAGRRWFEQHAHWRVEAERTEQRTVEPGRRIVLRCLAARQRQGGTCRRASAQIFRRRTMPAAEHLFQLLTAVADREAQQILY